jgi:hypothetical protein
MENKSFLHRSAGRRPYSILQAVKYISEINNLDALGKVLTEDIPPNKLIYIALSVDDWRIRKFISNMNGIREYMESLSYRGAIDIAQKIDDWDLWAITLSGSNVSPDNAVYFAKRLEILRVSQTVFSRKDVPWQEGLAYAQIINNLLFWQTILGILPPELAFSCGQEINGPIVGEAVMKRLDVQEYLRSISRLRVA